MTELQTRYQKVKRKLFDLYYAKELNDMQREAMYSLEGPLLVLAGAGSGKTTVLVKRIAFLVQYGNAYYDTAFPEGMTEAEVAELERLAASGTRDDIACILPGFISRPCPPWAVLAITFTNKAAREMKERLTATFEKEGIAGEIVSGTFHSVCLRILRKYPVEAGYQPNFSIYDTEDKKKLVYDCMKQLNIDDKFLPIRAVMTAISHAKDRLIAPDAYEAGEDLREKHIAKIYRLYQERLTEVNAVDFDDIIMQTVALLENNPEIAAEYQDRFRYICIDEYQDTNIAQFRLAEILSRKHRNLMVVGDDDQSIYRFRGATVENILTFDETYPRAKIVRLEQNYRSTKNILAVANAIIGHNEKRHAKKLWCDSAEGSLPYLTERKTQNEEAKFILDTVMDLVVKEKRNYRDIAILYRINELSRTLESALVKSGIPYRILGGQRFYDRKEIRDIVAYLHVLCNPKDNQRLKRIINEPKRKIGASTVDAVEELGNMHGMSMYEVMQQSAAMEPLAKASTKLTAFTDMMDRIRATCTRPSDAVRAVFEETGYHAMLQAEGEISRERIDSVEELYSSAIEYEKQVEQPSLIEFLEEVALVSDVDKYDEDANAVVLMTIHSAKGLEFPVVFLAGMEDGIFPSVQNLYNEEDLSEERRLAYVAVTRAKEKLYITHARERLVYGHTTYNKLSLFFREEVPEELLERAVSEAEKERPRTVYTPQKKQKPRISEEFFRRSDMAARQAETPTQSAHSYGFARLSKGDRIRHAVFGEGVILGVSDLGGDMLYIVRFDSGAEKKLMASYAKLQKI